MSQSVMQDSLTALILLHFHQQLSQVITQEVLLFGLQGRLVVIYCLSNSGLMSTRFFFPLRVNHVYHKRSARHRP